MIGVARHRDYLETEHSLLAVAAGQPVGFILTEPLDDALLSSKSPSHQARQQQGIGRMLLGGLSSARQMGYPAVTLTTFREVPWNAPFYTRLGFAMLDELTPARRAGLKGEQRRPGTACRRVALRHARRCRLQRSFSGAIWYKSTIPKLTRCYRMSRSIDIISCATDRFVNSATEKRIAQFILDDVAA